METTDASKGQNSERRRREHTSEERRKQRKEWKKRKRENRRAKSEIAPTGRNGADGFEVTPNVQKSASAVAVSQKVTRPSPENDNDIPSAVIDPKSTTKQGPALKTQEHSRGALLLRLAREIYPKHPRTTRNEAVISQTSQEQQPLPGPSRKFDSVKKFVVKEKKSDKFIELKELNP